MGFYFLMKVQTLIKIFKGEMDLKATKIYNILFGKKCLFIEKPHIYFNKIKEYIVEKRPKEIFILTPENYEDMIKPEFPEVTRKEFEFYFNKVVSLIKKYKIKTFLHIHLKKNTRGIPFKEKYKRTKNALKYLIKKGVIVKEVGFGWWRLSHSDLELKKVANKLGLNLAKRRVHIYDWWLK